MERVPGDEQGALTVDQLQEQVSQLSAAGDSVTDWERAAVLVQLGQAQMREGQDRQAVDTLGIAEAIFADVGGTEAALSGLTLLRAELLAGRMREYQEALGATDRLIGVEVDEADFAARVYEIRLTALRKLGRWEQASDDADALLSLIAEAGASVRERVVICRAHYARSVALLKRGDATSALVAVDSAIATARTLPADAAAHRARLRSMMLWHAPLLEALGRRAEARDAYGSVVSEFRHDSDDLAKEQVKLARLRRLQLLTGRSLAPLDGFADRWGADADI